MRWKAPDARWHMAYTSSNLAGIQAAVAAGMGLSILSEMAIQADHRVLTREGRLCADRPDRSGAGGVTRRQPGDVAAGGSAGRVLQRGASEGGVTVTKNREVGKGALAPVPTISTLRARWWARLRFAHPTSLRRGAGAQRNSQ